MGLLASCLSMLAVAAVPAPKLLDAGELRTGVFDREGVESSTEISEAGEAQALDLLWHQSADSCLQTGVYEIGPNRYTVDEPYPYDELMSFIQGGVTLTSSGGAVLTVSAGDTVLLPKGWRGVWESQGYRKIYVIYNCPTSR